jgi:hypothetical protein
MPTEEITTVKIQVYHYKEEDVCKVGMITIPIMSLPRGKTDGKQKQQVTAAT